MSRTVNRRRLSLEWWCLLAVAGLPLLLLSLSFGVADPGWPDVHMPVFVAGLLSMFVSLPLFSRYKHALIATQRVLDTPADAATWSALAKIRRTGMLVAALPAWIAALALFSGLNAVALMLLALSSLVICCLYRIPPQLG